MYQHQILWVSGLGQFWFWEIWVWGLEDLRFSFGVLVLVFFSDYCNEAIRRASQTSHNIARVKKTSLY
jgi:hypothetical protein